MEAYPLKFRPIYKSRIWGGQRLREFFGKDIPEGDKIGESWELADLPQDKSVITNGQFQGQTLSEVLRQYPEAITGNKKFSGEFPLLIKFLDANDILSVQVHPDGNACQRLGYGQPKTECWYIINAEPEAFIYKGLKEGVTRPQFSEAIEKGNVTELLAKIPVKAGQCHFLPAGTVHSIGAGLLVAEIQTPSNTTFRVFDFNRLDQNGKKRQLHIEQALESINFGYTAEQLPVTTIGRLVECEFFRIDKGHQAKNCEMLLSPGVMKTLIIITGCGNILTGGGDAVEFKAGDCLLIPAVYEGATYFADNCEYLIVTI